MEAKEKKERKERKELKEQIHFNSRLKEKYLTGGADGRPGQVFCSLSLNRMYKTIWQV